MWEAVETSPGVYNDTYLTEVDKLITALGEAGMYTLVDAHQDVLARIICGEGMPNFYAKEILEDGPYCFDPTEDILLQPVFKALGFCKSMKSYNFTTDSDGNPKIEDCQKHFFTDYYTSPESFTLFRAFYKNNFLIQDKYVAYWAKVAQRLSANKYVMGFDPFNEPMPSWDGIEEALYEITDGHFESTQLAPLYTRIHEKYMEVSNDTIMWFEPGEFPDTMPIGDEGVIFNVGFKKPPGGEIGSPHHVLNDHTYCCQLNPKICEKNGEPGPENAESCRKWHETKVGVHSLDAKKLGVPFFISEFGACLDTEACVTEITQVADVCDEGVANGIVGWSYWQYKTYHDLTTSAGDRSEGFFNNDGSL